MRLKPTRRFKTPCISRSHLTPFSVYFVARLQFGAARSQRIHKYYHGEFAQMHILSTSFRGEETPLYIAVLFNYVTVLQQYFEKSPSVFVLGIDCSS